MYSGVLIKTEVARIFIRVTDCDNKPLVHFLWKGWGEGSEFESPKMQR